MWTRRGFLGLGAWSTMALCLAREARTRARGPLVLLRLSGGNDGLNTLVPFADEQYRRLRPDLALREREVLRLDEQLGLHPSLVRLRAAFEQGRLGCVQGVGQPVANLSHFQSRAIWDAGSERGSSMPDGWLGRHYELLRRDDPLRASPIALLALGSDSLPLALRSRHSAWPAIPRLESWVAIAPEPETDAECATTEGSRAALVRDCLRGAREARELLARAAGRRPLAAYPDEPLAAALKSVADLVAAELPCGAVWVELDGFDTHTRQLAAQARMLAAVDGALGAFLEDVAQLRRLDDVLVLAFSEFGRRAAQSGLGADAGTDHGTAGPVFLLGGRVRAGIHGVRPDLGDLDGDGNLKCAVDFRRVYASVLEGWLGGDSERVLGGRWEPLEILRG